MADEKLKITIETEAGQAQKNIKAVGEQFLQMAKNAGATDEELGVLQASFQSMANQAKGAGDNVKDAGDKTKAAGDKTKDAGEKAEGFWGKLSKLADAARVAKAAFDILKGGFDLFEQALSSAAEAGDKKAQGIQGAFANMRNAAQEVETALVEGLAPALLPAIEGITELAKGLADWVSHAEIGKNATHAVIEKMKEFAPVIIRVKEMVGVVADSFGEGGSLHSALMVAKGVIALIIEGWQELGQAFADGSIFTEPVALMDEFVASMIEKLGKLAQSMVAWAADLDVILGTHTADSMALFAKNSTKMAEGWRKSAEDVRDASNVAAADMKTNTAGMIGALDSYDKKVQGTTDADIEAYAKDSEAYQKNAEKTKKAADELKKAHEELSDEISQSLGDLSSEIFNTLTEQQNKEQAVDAERNQKKLEAEEESYRNHLDYIKLTAESDAEMAKMTDEYLQGLLDSEETSSKLREQILLQFAAKRRQTNNEMLAQEKATQAKISETQAQAAAQQLKSEQAKQLKMGEIVAQGLGLILGKTKDWGTQILSMAKKLASDQLSVLQSQVTAELQEYQSLSSKYGQTEATMMLQSKSSMAAKLASAFAPLGPFAVPATAAAIAAMSAVVNAVGGAFKFESGKTSSGRPVGLGNADPDAPNAHVGPDETVLTGAQTRALGGSEAILAAAAGQGQQGGGAPGRMDVYVHHVFDGIPSSLKAILRPWMPTVLEAIDEQVLRYRSKLTATHFLSARNPA